MNNDDECLLKALATTVVETVRIDSLVESDSPRVMGEDTEHIQRLAECADALPPVIVDRSNGRVIDGMHRVRAATLRGSSVIDVRYVDDPELDRFVLAVQLNARHGLPLTRADRTRAAERVLASHPEWSDRMMASLTGLAASTIAQIRDRSTAIVPQLNERVGRDGKVRPISAAPGRERAAQLFVANPQASLRQVARDAGVSLGTAHDVRRRMSAGEDVMPSRVASRPREGAQARGLTGGPPHDQRKILTSPSWTELGKVLEHLKRDPSLRFSEGGRTVLRLFDLQSGFVGRQEQVAQSVPPHCGSHVAAMARACAGAWLNFANSLDDRPDQAPVVAGVGGAPGHAPGNHLFPADFSPRTPGAPATVAASGGGRALTSATVAVGGQA